MDAFPNIAEVSCVPLRFEAGDRVLVRVFQNLAPPQIAKIKATVAKWVNNDRVEILVIPAHAFDISVEKA